MTISSVYLYLQRPDTSEWVTVGRYTLNQADGQNSVASVAFKYAPSYLQAGHPWLIYPINLAKLDEVPYPAPRYNGLTDVLRDMAPDSWGKFLVQKEHYLSVEAQELDYLLHSGNGDRWGALAIGFSKKPSAATIASQKMPKLAELIEELQLLTSQK